MLVWLEYAENGDRRSPLGGLLLGDAVEGAAFLD
jgi:hypothetical protein